MNPSNSLAPSDLPWGQSGQISKVERDFKVKTMGENYTLARGITIEKYPDTVLTMPFRRFAEKYSTNEEVDGVIIYQ